MALPDSYTLKPNSIPAYFDAILNAEAPERFTFRFLQDLEFKSSNDRLIINVLKELGFIDQDGVAKQRYYEFLDRTQSPKVLAEAIREMYSGLFSVNKEAQKLTTEEVKNKLVTLYAGAKKKDLIKRIASTFTALCEYADFTGKPVAKKKATLKPKVKEVEKGKEEGGPGKEKDTVGQEIGTPSGKVVSLDSLQYHINIILPESRDQAIYDAIFKSLRDHLG